MLPVRLDAMLGDAATVGFRSAARFDAARRLSPAGRLSSAGRLEATAWLTAAAWPGCVSALSATAAVATRGRSPHCPAQRAEQRRTLLAVVGQPRGVVIERIEQTMARRSTSALTPDVAAAVASDCHRRQLRRKPTGHTCRQGNGRNPMRTLHSHTLPGRKTNLFPRFPLADHCRGTSRLFRSSHRRVKRGISRTSARSSKADETCPEYQSSGRVPPAAAERFPQPWPGPRASRGPWD